MSISQFHGTAVHGTTSVAPAFPGGYTPTLGDLAIISVGSGETGEATPTIDPGWFNIHSLSGGGGAFGADTGPRRATIFARILQNGDTAPTVSLAGSVQSLSAAISCYRRTAGTAWGVEVASGADTTSGTGFSALGTRNQGIQTNDIVHGVIVVCTDTTMSAQTVAATGCTFGTVDERVDSLTTNGNDQTLCVITATMTSGTGSTTAVTIGATLVAAAVGVGVNVRIREAYRLYVQPIVSPSISPAFQAWTTTVGAVRRTLTTTQSATTETVTSAWSGTLNQNALAYQAISPPLNGAHSFAGLFYSMTRSKESNLDDNTNKRWRYAAIINGDGSVVRGTLIAFGATGSTTELTTTFGGQIHGDQNVVSGVSALDGDRILIEMGYGGDAAGTTPSTDVVLGGTGWDHSTATQADVIGSVPWVEFTIPLAFKAGTSTGGFLSEMNRIAGTTGLGVLAAANAYAGTTGKGLLGALNAKAGNSLATYKGLQGVLNQLAGTTGLGILAAIRSIP